MLVYMLYFEIDHEVVNAVPHVLINVVIKTRLEMGKKKDN